MIVLETERLFLRRFTEVDADALFALESDPEVIRHLGRGPRGDVEAYRTHIRSTLLPWYVRPGGFGGWAVVEKASADFIGACSLRPALELHSAAGMAYEADDVEIGYGLRRASWGRGYATELAVALVHRAMTELRVARVVASVSPANLASIRVLEKAGLTRAEGLFPRPGEDVPSLKYVRGAGARARE